MIKKITPICVGLTLTFLMMTLGGCSASISTNSPSKPAANTNASPASNSNSASNSATAPKKADTAKPTAKLTTEKKPEGAESKQAKKVDIPKDWIYIYDDKKGYGFSVPEGSTGGSETQEGVDTFVATTPAPSEIGVVVITFKDKKMSKEDLLDVAVKFMEGMGEKVTAGKLTSESEDYSLAEVSSSSADGSKSKAKVLVGTDVTDNYVMIVGADDAKFAANEKVIDEIWGSFQMWSGGSSGKN